MCGDKSINSVKTDFTKLGGRSSQEIFLFLKIINWNIFRIILNSKQSKNDTALSIFHWHWAPSPYLFSAIKIDWVHSMQWRCCMIWTQRTVLNSVTAVIFISTMPSSAFNTIRETFFLLAPFESLRPEHVKDITTIENLKKAKIDDHFVQYCIGEYKPAINGWVRLNCRFLVAFFLNLWSTREFGSNTKR